MAQESSELHGKTMSKHDSSQQYTQQDREFTLHFEDLNRNIENELPNEILMDILSRLPVKSLLRFISVQRSWCEMIKDDPIFINLHIKQSALNYKDRVGFTSHSNEYYISLHSLRKYDDPPQYIDLPPKFHNYQNEVVGCCNGLLCVYSYSFKTSTVQFFLFNPATREFKEIPKPYDVYYRFNIGYGFGFDPKTNDYKLVRISEAMVSNSLSQAYSIVQVYSLLDDSWRRSGTFIEGVIACRKIEGMLEVDEYSINRVNGALHWKATRGTGNEQVWFIIVFNINSEKVWDMMLPNLDINEAKNCTLFVFKESLSVIVEKGAILEHIFDIWIMKEHGVKESWVRQLRIGPYISISSIVDGFCGPNCELLLNRANSNTLFLYEPNSQELKQLGNHDYSWPIRAYSYFESLVPVKGIRILPRRDWRNFSYSFGLFLCFGLVSIICYFEFGSSHKGTIRRWFLSLLQWLEHSKNFAPFQRVVYVLLIIFAVIIILHYD